MNEQQETEVIVQLLRATAQNLVETGFPKQTMILGTDICQGNLQMHLTLWRQTAPDRTTTKIMAEPKQPVSIQ